MSGNNLFRVGGVAAILSVLLSFGAYVLPVFLAIGALVMAVFIFALYRLFNAKAPTLSLIAAVLGIAGAVVMAIHVLMSGMQTSALLGIAIWAAFFLPPLIFGILAYQHSQAGMPRVLAIIGIVGGIGGLVNLVVTMIGGGDWAHPNNPALTPVIMGSYYLGMLPTLVWLMWSGIALVRMAGKQQAATAV
jgi:hypothetical protein